MSLHFSAAHSSRIRKRSQPKIPPLRSSSSSPFASCRQRKPVQRSKTKPESTTDDNDLFDERLEDMGLVPSLALELTLRDVPQIIMYVNSHMFDAVPERGGLTSTRIAEILNFRRSLPPVQTVSHVHALTVSPTQTEREISELIKVGVLRKITIPGRGIGGSGVGGGLIVFQDMERILNESNHIQETSRSKQAFWSPKKNP